MSVEAHCDLTYIDFWSISPPIYNSLDLPLTHSRKELNAHAMLEFIGAASLVPRPHPLRGKRGLVNLDRFLGLASSVDRHHHCRTETNIRSAAWVWADDSNL